MMLPDAERNSAAVFDSAGIDGTRSVSRWVFKQVTVAPIAGEDLSINRLRMLRCPQIVNFSFLVAVWAVGRLFSSGSADSELTSA